MLRSLFFVFFRIGLFTFGGGYAMLPLIERDIVDKHQWMTHEEFIDMFAIAQTLPGVFAVNLSVFVGYRLRRLRGGIVAALGTILPSFLIILLLAIFFENVRDNRYVAAAMQGIRPAVIALIALPVYTTWRKMKLPPFLLIIPIASALMVWFFGISPIIVLFIAALGGIIYSFWLKPFVRKHFRR